MGANGRLTGAPADTGFGVSVGVSGNTAIVTAQPFGESGSAYVFSRDDVSGAWQQVARLSSGQRGDNFGYAVAIDADTAVVGALRDREYGAVRRTCSVATAVAGVRGG